MFQKVGGGGTTVQPPLTFWSGQDDSAIGGAILLGWIKYEIEEE